MNIENVRAFFRGEDLEDRILEFDVSSATVELAAEAVGCEPKRIAKTMAFKVDDQPVLVVAAGDAKVQNSLFKQTFASKAKMLNPQELIEMVGWEPGGVCPFLLDEKIRIYLDESLKRFETVYPSAGSSNSAIKLTLEELEKYSGSHGWVDVCSQWRE